MQYLFGRNERGEYLDFYCRHRHADDQHWRSSSKDIEENARLQEAFYAENTRIYKLLRDKGFED